VANNSRLPTRIATSCYKWQASTRNDPNCLFWSGAPHRFELCLSFLWSPDICLTARAVSIPASHPLNSAPSKLLPSSRQSKAKPVSLPANHRSTPRRN